MSDEERETADHGASETEGDTAEETAAEETAAEETAAEGTAAEETADATAEETDDGDTDEDSAGAADEGAAHEPGAPILAADDAPLAVARELRGPEGEVVEASEVRRRGRAILFGGLGLLGAVVLGGLGVSLYSSALVNEETSEWTRAEHGRDEAAWQRYVTWASEAEAGGGLRAFLLERMTPIHARSLVAAERALTARADAAATREDWPVLCELLRDHATTPAADRARGALHGRVERAIAAYRQSATSHHTPREVTATVIGALEAARDANPCATRAVLSVVHEVSDAPAFAVNAGSGSVAAVLTEALDEERAHAVFEALSPELERVTSSVLALEEPSAEPTDDEPILGIVIRCRVAPYGVFLTPSRRELPGVELSVEVEVTSPAPAAVVEAPTEPSPPRNELVTYRLPQDFGLELFRDQRSDDGVEDAYARMIDLLYAHVRDRAGQVLGTQEFQRGGNLDFGCQSIRPLAANRLFEGSTRGEGDAHIGSCLESDDEGYDEYSDDGEYPEMPEMGFRLVVPTRSEVAVVAEAEFAAGVYLRRSCSGSQPDLACDAEDAQIEATLDPGVYYVFVDGTYDDEEGEFSIYAAVRDVDEVARACRAAPAVALGQAVTGTTVDHADVTQGQCGGVGGGDVLQTIEVPASSRLRCSVEGSGHAMYLRRSCTSHDDEIGCARSSVTGPVEITTLASGRYTLGIDAIDPDGEGPYSWRCDAVPQEGVDGVAADSCTAPGAIDLSTGSATVEIDTFAAKDDLHGACGGTGAPDLVYRFEVREPSLLSARWATPGFRGALTVRGSCAPDAGELSCARATATTFATSLAAGTYFLTVDGAGASSFGRGQLTLELESLTRVCESGPMLRSGQREAITLPSGTRSRFGGSCGGGSGSEIVRRFAVERRSQVVATAEMPFSGFLYLRRQCSDDHSEVACVARTATGSATIDTALDPGLYYLVADASNTTPVGSIGVRVDITPL